MLQGQGERGAEGRNSPGLKQQLPAVKARLHGQDSFRAETPRVLWCGTMVGTASAGIGQV
ncbi:Uncharacterised protein [uncultured Blautia sp.]|nr:Uncharacterised protein [uncultured Blautia sp.]